MRVVVVSILIFCGSLALMLLPRRAAEPSQVVVEGPQRTATCMVWRAEKGAGVVWLCGSIHVLQETDYPLPSPWQRALQEAQRVVLEIEPGPSKFPRIIAALRESGTLPAATSLRDVVTPATWNDVEGWARGSGRDLSLVLPLKPWRAALTVTSLSQQALGYLPEHGVESWLNSRCVGKTTLGLETPEAQIKMLAGLDAESQERMLRAACGGYAGTGERMRRIAQSWREGDVTGLDRMLSEEMGEAPVLRERLLTVRHEAWMPHLEQYLGEPTVTLFVAGAIHFCGEDGIVARLRRRGVTVEQQTYTTTRPLPLVGPPVQ